MPINTHQNMTPEQEPILERKQRPDNNKPDAHENQPIRAIEKIPGTGILRQILLSSPISIAFKGESGAERKFKNVPATFSILSETRTMYKIGDDQGNEIGWIEKSPQVREWSVQSVFITDDMPERTGTLPLYSERGGTQPVRVMSTGRRSVFPVLEVRDGWYKITTP